MTNLRGVIVDVLRASEPFRPLRWRIGQNTVARYVSALLAAAPVVASVGLTLTWAVGVIDQLGFVSGLLAVNEVPGVFILAVSLWCTPLTTLTGRPYRRQRKWFGLSFGWCAAMNLLAFLLEHPAGQLAQPFAILGTLAVALCVPLVITSTHTMIRRLGSRNWRRLHRLAYVIGGAVIVHLWLVPQDDGPGGNAVASIVFLAAGIMRIPPISNALVRRRQTFGASLLSLQTWLAPKRNWGGKPSTKKASAMTPWRV